MNPCHFTISTNELLAALRILGIKTILGLPADPYAGMTEGEIVDLLADGFQRFFHDRGLYEASIDLDHPERAIFLEIQRVLGVCAFCERSLVANHSRMSGEESWLAWHQLPTISGSIVQYDQPGEGDHQFQTLDGAVDLVPILQDNGYLPGQAIERQGYEITILTEDVSRLRQNTSSTVDGLDMDHPLRQALAETGHHLWLGLIRYDDTPDKELNFLYANRHAWVVQDTLHGVRFIPCTTQEVNQGVQAFINDFVVYSI